MITCKIFCIPSFLFKNIKLPAYRNINLPFVLFGCDNSSFTLREELRLRVFQNRALLQIRAYLVPFEFILVSALKFATCCVMIS